MVPDLKAIFKIEKGVWWVLTTIKQRYRRVDALHSLITFSQVTPICSAHSSQKDLKALPKIMPPPIGPLRWLLTLFNVKPKCDRSSNIYVVWPLSAFPVSFQALLSLILTSSVTWGSCSSLNPSTVILLQHVNIFLRFLHSSILSSVPCVTLGRGLCGPDWVTLPCASEALLSESRESS